MSNRKSIFFKYFVICSAVILISFVCLGTVLLLVSSRYFIDEKKSLLEKNTKALALYTQEEMLAQPADWKKSVTDEMMQYSMACNADFILCDSTGAVLVNSSKDPVCSPHNISVHELEAFSDNCEYVYSDLGGAFDAIYHVIGKSFKANGPEYYVLAFSSKAAQDDYTYNIMEIFIVSAIIVLVIVMFLVYFMTLKLTEPIKEIAEVSKKIGAGDFSVTLPDYSTSELEQLSNAFNDMAASLKSYDTMRNSFLANVSHELRTPMTSIGGFVDGLLDGVVTVLTFIPVMGIMFLLLSILEDSGYMARAAFVMDRAMRALGLDGRAFLPIIVGFGCNLPALAATRTLSDSRQRVLTGMLVPFAACSARLSVFLVLAHAFFPKYAGLVVFLMYVASVMVVLLVGVLLRHTMFRGLEPEPLMLALPAYQCPRALQLARSVLLRLWGFIRGASVIIISMITALWLLQGIPVTANAGGFAHVDDVHDSAYGVLADAVAPVFAPAGFDDWHASAALITGFVAKEVVVGSMSQSYHADEPDDATSQQAGEGTLGQKLRASFDQSSHGHGKAAAIAFLLFTLAYTPCLATVAEMRRQFGTKVAARSVLLSLAVAYVIAIIAFQTLRLIW